jgi:eukaryotic-like serine/threonine-protein kinase
MSKHRDDNGPEPLARGAAIGRYVVLNLLGRGGMGEVYAAFDPELDRKVAVKLLRARIENGVTLTEGRQRTLREAQAIARLSHPNVIVVYDVGTFREQVFIAMEFVDGHTASYWAHAQPRTWQEILKVYMAAGRGLQAAHEKGMVHRDFKPENVMVGRDGEVRVMDFGLARQIDGRPAVPSPSAPVTTTTARFGDLATEGGTIVLHRRPDGGAPVTAANVDGVVQDMQDTDPSANSDVFNARLTRTGAIMGTPAYMAPEQFFKAATDARSDQFSFCVTLYEALYGERPFPGNNIQSLVGNIVQGNIREAPHGSKVPFWLRRVLLRGLRPTPAERFASMADLLEALRKDPRVRYRRIAVGAMAALLPLGFGLGARQVMAERPPVCTAGAERLAGVWELSAPNAPEGPHQTRVHEAFLRTGKTYAADVYETVRHTLSDYAHRWSGMYQETCEATQVRHEQSPDVLDLRMSCLNDRLNGLHALTHLFESATAETVENAVSAAANLAPVDHCADVQTLRAVIKPPDDPSTRARVDDVRQRLADVKARFDAGRWKEAIQQAPKLAAAARKIGYKPLLAEALDLLGQIYIKANDARAAEGAMVEAFSVADSSRHDEVRAEVASNLVYTIGYEDKKFDEARQWFEIASAVLQRLGGHDLQKAWLLNNMGCAYFAHGQMDAGLDALKQGMALKERLLGREQLDLALSEGNVSYVLNEMGRHEEGLSHADQSIAITVKKLGPEHPLLAIWLSNKGEILNALGRYGESAQVFNRARTILERELGPDAHGLAGTLTGLGISYLGQSRPTEAIAVLDRVLRIDGDNPEDPKVHAEALFTLARALWETRGDAKRARHLAQEARGVFGRVADQEKASAVDNWLTGHPAS